ncbi:MAG: YqgE/AlgH family protein [Bacteroidetes bacterium]|jgi:putative transcriptional regulator|nr:YqgE/AlgH family protein [Bacteroidota bacterium]MBT3800848.1 YqgE/AlgH family protein [Bacteroidota bacterium]MBT4969307.1 YqgE/AlgH family protein [Bacteroidota bacterium]MBT7827217.1 YqgE/AlgH family protein [Bacteroidota bacterium]
MTITALKPHRGRVLVSVPFLNDHFFGRSVVLLTDHNEEGSVGLILNKPLETKINEAIADFPEFNATLYLGGPVDNQSLFYLHTLGDTIADSIEIMPGLFWGGNFETIKLMIENKQIEPSEIKFFVGYSGWQEDQLERELSEKSWVVQKSSVKNVMLDQSEDYWKYYIKKADKTFSVWADFPVNPSLN